MALAMAVVALVSDLDDVRPHRLQRTRQVPGDPSD
jgi:hypothetical protein